MSSSNGCNRSGPSSRRSTDRAREQGYALLAVVGVLAVLSVIAVTILQRARLGISSATAFLEETRDQYAVEVGMTSAIRALSAEPEFDHNGYLHLEVTADERRLSILVSDESRKVDVNRASRAELVEAFIAVGVDRNVAEVLSHRMVDWRDADDRPQQHGGEIGDYLAAGDLAIPRNAKFVSLDEIQTVLDMPAEITVRLNRQFTLTPSIMSDPRSAMIANASIPQSIGGSESMGDTLPSSDGITRRADAAVSPEVFGVQIRLMRELEIAEWEQFRYLAADARDR